MVLTTLPMRYHRTDQTRISLQKSPDPIIAEILATAGLTMLLAPML